MVYTFLSVYFQVIRHRVHLHKQQNQFEILRASLLQFSNHEIVLAALRAFRRCYRKGYQYKRAGVIVSGVSSRNAIQQDLFDTVTPEQRNKLNRLSEVVDKINHRMGRDTMILGVQQFPVDEQTGEALNFRDLISHKYRSRCYTTDINELLEVR